MSRKTQVERVLECQVKNIEAEIRSKEREIDLANAQNETLRAIKQEVEAKLAELGKRAKP